MRLPKRCCPRGTGSISSAPIRRGSPPRNLTVHNSIRTSAVQRSLPRPPRLNKNMVYATVIFTDGDNIGVLIGHHEARWVAPDRGHVPVGWSMQGMAPSWTPGIARHYFEPSTFNDEMVAWLPFGYPDLRSLVISPHWDQYVAAAQAAITSAGLAVSQDLPHRNSVPSEERSGAWSLLHGSKAPSGHIVGYQGPPGIYPVGEAIWIDGRPIFTTGGYAPSGLNPSALAVSAIANVAAANDERPLFVVVGLGNCTKYADAVATVKAHFDAPVRFVLPSQLVKLQRQAWRAGLARTSLLGLARVHQHRPLFPHRGRRPFHARRVPLRRPGDAGPLRPQRRRVDLQVQCREVSLALPCSSRP